MHLFSSFKIALPLFRKRARTSTLMSLLWYFKMEKDRQHKSQLNKQQKNRWIREYHCSIRQGNAWSKWKFYVIKCGSPQFNREWFYGSIVWLMNVIHRDFDTNLREAIRSCLHSFSASGINAFDWSAIAYRLRELFYTRPVPPILHVHVFVFWRCHEAKDMPYA